MYRYSLFIITLITAVNAVCGFAQKDTLSDSFFTPAPSYDATRFARATAAGVLAYTGTVIALDRAWYAQQPRGRFRFFNDWSGWQQIDKLGHAMTGYYQSALLYKGGRWTGLSKKQSLWTAGITSSMLLLTVEVMDGFVTTYGFSPSDIVFNTLGVGLFVVQEAIWDRQWAVLKFSTSLITYDENPIKAINSDALSSAAQRARSLYGTFFAERWLKDYNAQNYWISIFPFVNHDWIPSWAGISLGYGAGNMYGANNNIWTENTDQFNLNELYPRYRQFMVSLDIDLTLIKVKSPFLKSLFSVINFIKIPLPTLTFNTLGQWRLHPVYW